MLALKIIAAIIFVICQYFTVPVLQDPVAKPPVRADMTKKPKLIIHVNKDGASSHQGIKISEDRITELSREHKKKHPDGILNLRGDKGTSFKHIRTVIRAAAKGGLDNVVFSVFGHEGQAGKAKQADAPKPLQNLVGKTIKPRENDLKMSLPAVEPRVKKALPALEPMFISIAANGTVSINRGKAKEALDADPAKRDLPKLKERLKAYATAAEAGGHDPIVQIWADKEAKQQRVVDVLNALAGAGVGKVTFTDLVDAE